jgi:sugar phosphate isomerase/epimerase
MFLSGIADEAGSDLATQIRAHESLGWKHIELRTVDGANVTDVDDRTFDSMAQRLCEAGLHVSCIASQIANWSRPIDTDFELDRAELRRAIPRMHRLGTKLIRCMSYPNSDPPLTEARWRNLVIRRLKALVQIAADAGVTLVHENCHGWAGDQASRSLALLEEIGSPSFRLLFDTGNPTAHGQDAWEFYRAVRNEVTYVHVKDYRLPGQRGEEPSACFAGEGDSQVERILRDLVTRGYDGGISIEPHITSVIHLQQRTSDANLAFETYVQYGRSLEQLVARIRALVA